MPPIALLGMLLAALVVTIIVDRGQRRRRGHVLFTLARASRMNYSPLDRFDLAGRLRASPEWVTESTELRIRDVLYAAHGPERRFVATAFRRHSRDVRGATYVVACVERLDDGAFQEITPRRAFAGPPLEPYRDALAAFEQRAAHAGEGDSSRSASSACSSSSDGGGSASSSER